MKIMSWLKFALPVLVGGLASMLHAQRTQVALDGEWRFSLDPVQAGVEQGWFKPDLPVDKWDKVVVPHCFSSDPRYLHFTGSAWYLKKFSATRAAGVRTFLRFEAAFYRTQVWLNGTPVGDHEGGYTPFEFDVTDLLAGENHLAVHVNNAWSTKTIPGAKTRVDYQSLNYGQLYPWMNYGGITREVWLISRPETHLDKLKVEASPDLAAKTAQLRVSARVNNRSVVAWEPSALQLTVSLRGKEVPVKFIVSGSPVAAGADGEVRAEAELDGVELWDLDHPVLYRLEARSASDVVGTTFGIRKIEIRGTKFLLNGEAISLGGANRPADAPGYGSMDPAHVLEADLQLMKRGGMRLSRITHYAPSSRLLDWADENGLLIIGEAGNWQMTPAQMADPELRAKFRSQMREMVERDWNHPSIIAWSVGNEYQSQTPEGIAWTRDMRDFTRSIDATRLITFATHTVAKPSIRRPEEEASHLVDFISVNSYENHLEELRRVHALFPDKPIYVSEFGFRADAVVDEQDRIGRLRKAVAAFRECGDFLMGASVWTFNDYRSLFPGTNANGYRPWGLVSPEREPRGMYYAWQEELAPATLAFRELPSGQVQVMVSARSDFPRRPLRDHRLRVGGRTYPLPVLAPGERVELTVDRPAGIELRSVHLEGPAADPIPQVASPVPAPRSRTETAP